MNFNSDIDKIVDVIENDDVSINVIKNYSYTNPKRKLQQKNNWNKIIENNIKKIGEKTQGYKIMHIKSAYNVSKIYNIFMYLCIILGPLSGLISGIGAIINPETEITYPIVASIISFISGIIVAIIKFGKFEEVAALHKVAATKYNSLENNIRTELSLIRSNRVDIYNYMEWLSNSYNELFLSSPFISKKTYNKYIENANKKGIAIPEYGDNIIINDNNIGININRFDSSNTIDSSNNKTIEIGINTNEMYITDIKEGELKEGELKEGELKEGELKEGGKVLSLMESNNSNNSDKSNKSNRNFIRNYDTQHMKYELNRMMNDDV